MRRTMEKPSAPAGALRQAWLVILLALLYGGALAGLQTSLKQRIADNKEAETVRVVPQLLLGPDMPEEFQRRVEKVPAAETGDEQPPKYTVGIIPILDGEADKSEEIVMTVEKLKVAADGNDHCVYKAASDDTLIGWVLPAGGQGFADRIEVLIGLDATLSAITGLYVLDQKETPGLGNLIKEPDFCKRFSGKSTVEPLMVVKGQPLASNEILAVTAATISSESVARIVNNAIKNLKGPIGQLASTPAAETQPASKKPEQ